MKPIVQLLFLTCGLCVWLDSVEAQEKKPVVSVLREGDGNDNQGAIAFSSLNEFQADVVRLATDLNLPWLKSGIENVADRMNKCIAPNQPMLILLDGRIFGTPLIGTPPSEEVWEGVFVESENGLDDPSYQLYQLLAEDYGVAYELGCIHQDTVFLANHVEDLQRAIQLKPLAPGLDEGSKALFNESGVSLYSQTSRNQFENLAWQWDEQTDHEREFLAKLLKKFEKPTLGIIGMKYHDRVLETRLRGQLDLETEFDDLFRIDLPKEKYDSDLGLTKNGLLVAASMRMEVARDSAIMRIVPAITLNSGSNNRQFAWLGGTTLNMLSELVGDSWVDLEAARGAIYRSPTGNGKYQFVGVVDSRDPDIVMQELRRISTLIQPSADNELTEAQLEELQRLIEMLASTDRNLVARAETRLALAGPRALKQLELRKESVSPAIEASLQRVIRRIKQEAKSQTKDLDVLDPNFWSQLRPGLQLNEGTGKWNEYPIHTIIISPDPSKDQQEVAKASAAMKVLFGENWARIQVVQIRKHFVFMMGSDDDLLKKVVSNVAQGEGELEELVPRFGNPNHHGAMQIYAFLQPLGEELGFESRHTDEDPRMSFASLEIQSHALQIQLLVPTESIRSYVRFWFGGGF